MGRGLDVDIRRWSWWLDMVVDSVLRCRLQIMSNNTWKYNGGERQSRIWMQVWLSQSCQHCTKQCFLAIIKSTYWSTKVSFYLNHKPFFLCYHNSDFWVYECLYSFAISFSLTPKPFWVFFCSRNEWFLDLQYECSQVPSTCEYDVLRCLD